MKDMKENRIVRIPERMIGSTTEYTESKDSPTIKVGSEATLGKDQMAKYGLTTKIEDKITSATFIVKRILNMMPETIGKGPTLVTNSNSDANPAILTIIVLEYNGDDSDVKLFLKTNRLVQSRKNINFQEGEFAVLPTDIVKIS